eukprot:jgi/Mesvir1/19827/Mv13117-RA.1
MEFRTVQGASIKLLVETLKELTNDVNFSFTPDAVRMMAFDNAHCCLFHVCLEKENIEEYRCSKPFVVGIGLVNFYKLLKNVSINDELELKLDGVNLDRMEINITNNVKKTKWSYSMKLLDIDEDSLEIPQKEYMTIITMVSSEFQRICRDLHVISDIVRIKCSGSEIVMSCSGDIGDCVLQIGKEFPDMKIQLMEDKEIDEVFSLRYLCTFSKAAGLCNSVSLFLSHEYPLVVKYKVGDLGTLMFMLAPKMDDENEDPVDADAMEETAE